VNLHVNLFFLCIRICNVQYTLHANTLSPSTKLSTNATLNVIDTEVHMKEVIN
jgi:hypothetical protein